MLGSTYISKKNVKSFLSRLVKSQKLTQGNPKDFWHDVRFLDIQSGGNSQHEILMMFSKLLQKEVGYAVGDCGTTKGTTFVYLDDGLFTGNRILGDLRTWISESAPNEATVHVAVMALHRGGQYYAKTNLMKAAKEAGKKIEINWWRAVELEDRKAHTDTSDVLRPTKIPDNSRTKAYVKAFKYPPVLRKPGNIGDLKLFSSEDARGLLEQEFLMKGTYIREICPRLPKSHRPLGNMVLQTLGFGSTIVTFRNCPNNAPLAFWAGHPWLPLFERKTN